MSKPRLMIHGISASSREKSLAEGTEENHSASGASCTPVCHQPETCTVNPDMIIWTLTQSSSPPSLTLNLPSLGSFIIIAPLSSGVLIRFRPFLSQLFQSNSGSITLKKETDMRKSTGWDLKPVHLSLTGCFEMIATCVALTSFTAGPCRLPSAVEEGCFLFPSLPLPFPGLCFLSASAD